MCQLVSESRNGSAYPCQSNGPIVGKPASGRHCLGATAAALPEYPHTDAIEASPALAADRAATTPPWIKAAATAQITAIRAMPYPMSSRAVGMGPGLYIVSRETIRRSAWRLPPLHGLEAGMQEVAGRCALTLEALLVEQVCYCSLHRGRHGNEDPLRRQLSTVVMFCVTDIEGRDSHCSGHVLGFESPHEKGRFLSTSPR